MPLTSVTVVVCVCILFSANLAVALNLNKIVPIPEFPKENVTTGNKILYEQTGNDTTDNLASGQFMEVNEIPVRFDETQLWRIYNISRLRSASQVHHTLENRFGKRHPETCVAILRWEMCVFFLGGNVWKENSKFLDISFRKEQVKNARSYLQGLNISSEVLNENIQNLLDQELYTGEDFRSARASKDCTWLEMCQIKI